MAAVPEPRTWADGDFFTVPILNTELRDTFNFLLNRPRIVVRRASTAQHIPSGTSFTDVGWDTEDTDNYAGWTPSLSARFTVPVAGKWSVFPVISWLPSATGIRSTAVGINGSSTEYAIATIPSASGSVNTIVPAGFTIPYTFAVGEYFTIRVAQNTGGTLDHGGPTGASFCTIQWEGVA